MAVWALVVWCRLIVYVQAAKHSSRPVLHPASCAASSRPARTPLSTTPGWLHFYPGHECSFSQGRPAPALPDAQPHRAAPPDAQPHRDPPKSRQLCRASVLLRRVRFPAILEGFPTENFDVLSRPPNVDVLPKNFACGIARRACSIGSSSATVLIKEVRRGSRLQGAL